MPRVLRWSYGGALFLMSEAPLQLGIRGADATDVARVLVLNPLPMVQGCLAHTKQPPTPQDRHTALNMGLL